MEKKEEVELKPKEAWQIVQKKHRHQKKKRTGENKRVIAAKQVKRRLSKIQAVIIKRPNEGRSYCDILRSIEEKVNLEQLQITVTNTRMTTAGSILLEVKGKDKADKLYKASIRTIRRSFFFSPVRTTAGGASLSCVMFTVFTMKVRHSRLF